jgi:hypothetical protein
VQEELKENPNDPSRPYTDNIFEFPSGWDNAQAQAYIESAVEGAFVFLRRR